MLRPDINKEIQMENTQQCDEDDDEDENNPKEDIGNDLDDMEDDIKEITHPKVKGSRIRQVYIQNTLHLNMQPVKVQIINK